MYLRQKITREGHFEPILMHSPGWLTPIITRAASNGSIYFPTQTANKLNTLINASIIFNPTITAAMVMVLDNGESNQTFRGNSNGWAFHTLNPSSVYTPNAESSLCTPSLGVSHAESSVYTLNPACTRRRWAFHTLNPACTR